MPSVFGRQPCGGRIHAKVSNCRQVIVSVLLPKNDLKPFLLIPYSSLINVFLVFFEKIEAIFYALWIYPILDSFPEKSYILYENHEIRRN